MFQCYELFILLFIQKPSQQKYKTIGEGVELSVESDVSVAELDAVLDVREFVVVGDKLVEGRRRVVIGLDLNRDERFCISHEEVHLHGGFLIAEEEQAVALFDKRLSNDILVDCALISIEITIDAQVFLCFIIQSSDQQDSVFEIKFEVRGVIIAFQRKRHLVETIADINNTRITKKTIEFQ